LKKRTKKLLSVAGGTVLPDWTGAWEQQAKVFLALFFKKELLASPLTLPWRHD
jgi:hypothetical protein